MWSEILAFKHLKKANFFHTHLKVVKTGKKLSYVPKFAFLGGAVKSHNFETVHKINVKNGLFSTIY